MIDISVSNQWRQAFPGAHIGMLLMGNMDNRKRSTPLDELKKDLVFALRSKYDGYSRADLLKTQVLRAYKAYYRNFGKTYHIQLQLESILHKGKSLPNVSPLVDANFAAEMETFLLSAGHDADRLCSPVRIGKSHGTEAFIQINGSKKTLKANDMVMTDAKGVVCTVIYGQDQRTPISPNTRRALYVTYVPPGIETASVATHLETIKKNIILFAPDAAVEFQQVYSADGP
ncbi:phenylalanine--tRNA ligase beta subunit-related protein [Desulfobacula sp.]|uniref:phenylalanine--tRNA ligase beta subunit-related protein n=1 Tax=Desulfobacula sp. TaxID=2593537 RepID=UPI002631FB4B|nr:phenylalanine--tRNA ligase beta subunit-related protein [Desulfobacula sp.]